MEGAPHGTLVLAVIDPTAPPMLDVADVEPVVLQRHVGDLREHAGESIARANAALVEVGFVVPTREQFEAAVVGIARDLLGRQGRAN